MTTERQLADKVGVQAKERKIPVKEIFGENGIAACGSSEDFQVKCKQFLESYSSKSGSFQQYFEKHL